MKENFEKQSIDAGQLAFESSQNAKPILAEITKKIETGENTRILKKYKRKLKRLDEKIRTIFTTPTDSFRGDKEETLLKAVAQMNDLQNEIKEHLQSSDESKATKEMIFTEVLDPEEVRKELIAKNIKEYKKYLKQARKDLGPDYPEEKIQWNFIKHMEYEKDLKDRVTELEKELGEELEKEEKIATNHTPPSNYQSHP